MLKQFIKKIIGNKYMKKVHNIKRIMICIKYNLTKSYSASIEQMEETIDKECSNLSDRDRAKLRKKMFYAKTVDGFSYEEYFDWRVDSLSKNARKAAASCRRRIEVEDQLNTRQERYNNKINTYYAYQKYFKRDVVAVCSENDIDNFQRFTEKHNCAIIKPADGMQGKGVFVVDDLSLWGGVSDILKQYPHGVVVEEKLVNVSEIAEFHPMSLNTVRIQTIVIGEGKRKKIDIFLAVFKVGSGNGIADNSHAGGISQPIDVNSGIVLCSKFFPAKNTIIHPDTGKQIVGFQIPRWEEAKHFVCELAEQDEENKFVAWDIALTDRGWCLIEGNIHGDFFAWISDPLDMYDRMVSMCEKKEFK